MVPDHGRLGWLPSSRLVEIANLATTGSEIALVRIGNTSVVGCIPFLSHASRATVRGPAGRGCMMPMAGTSEDQYPAGQLRECILTSLPFSSFVRLPFCFPRRAARVGMADWQLSRP